MTPKRILSLEKLIMTEIAERVSTLYATCLFSAFWT